MECHPRIKEESSKLIETRIILGSFPTWPLTAIDSDKAETEEEKLIIRTLNKDFLYFFGSSTNKFWSWYKEYIDENIAPSDINSIQNSLCKNSIGITDILLSCKRKGRSALDKDLTSRTYNHNFFEYPNSNETIKILCTSKGVLNEMFLNKKFFKLHPQITINETYSQEHQTAMVKAINGETSIVAHPLYQKLDFETGGAIECLAIPSPGSPFRKLDSFGNINVNLEEYLKNYLSFAFNWFMS